MQEICKKSFPAPPVIFPLTSHLSPVTFHFSLFTFFLFLVLEEVVVLLLFLLHIVLGEYGLEGVGIKAGTVNGTDIQEVINIIVEGE